jgi:ABC-type transport system involved in cytochrome c biogenesis permease subunit
MSTTDASSMLLIGAVGGYAGSLIFHCLRHRRSAWMTILLAAGFGFHTLSLIARSWSWGVFSLNGVFNASHFLPWCFALLALLLLWKKSEDAASIVWPTVIAALLGLLLPISLPAPGPFSATLFSPAFFFLEVLATACWLLAGWFAWRFLRGRYQGTLFNSLAIWGFILYSLAQIVGAIWSYLGWATLFHWSERHLQSAAIWCCYCGYLHTHFDRAVTLRHKARWALTGAGLMLVFGYVLQVVPYMTLFAAKAKPEQVVTGKVVEAAGPELPAAVEAMNTTGREER